MRRKAYLVDDETISLEEFAEDGTRRVLAGEIDDEDPTVLHVRATGHPYLIFRMKAEKDT